MAWENYRRVCISVILSVNRYTVPWIKYIVVTVSKKPRFLKVYNVYVLSGKKFATIVFWTCSLEIDSEEVLIFVYILNQKSEKILLNLNVVLTKSYKHFLNFAACTQLIDEYSDNTHVDGQSKPIRYSIRYFIVQ